MIEESHTRRPSRPRTRRSRVDHRHRAGAHRAGADRVVVGLAGAEGVVGQLARRWSRSGPGWRSARRNGLSAGWRRISRAMPQALAATSAGRTGRPSSWGRSAARPAGSALCSRTVPRERGWRKAEFSVTPGFFSFSTPASMPEPRPRWNWMSGEGADRIGVPEAAGLEEGRGDRAAPEQDVLQAGPERAVQLGVVVVGVVAGAFGRSRRRRDDPGGSRRRRAGRGRPGRRRRADDRPGRCPTAAAAAASRWRRR